MQPEIMRYNYFYISFFNFIRYTFGLNSVLLLKKWIHHSKAMSRSAFRSEAKGGYRIISSDAR